MTYTNSSDFYVRNNTLDRIVEELNKAKKIVITSHLRPDADCVGSGLALYEALTSIGKEVEYYKIDKLPYPLSALPGAQNIKIGKIPENNIDLVVCIEGANEKRTGHKNLRKFRTINIDHHPSGERDADINWIEDDAAAVGELMFFLIERLNVKYTRNILFNLYATISSDTGSFKYSNTTYRSLALASKMSQLGGFSPNEVSELLFNTNPLEKVQMIPKILNTLELYFKQQVAMIDFKKDFLKSIELQDVETEDIVAIVRTITNVKVTLFFKEIDKDSYRVSIRSKGNFNSQKIALYYGGGGHKHASGFFCQGKLKDIKEKILELIQNHLEE